MIGKGLSKGKLQHAVISNTLKKGGIQQRYNMPFHWFELKTAEEKLHPLIEHSQSHDGCVESSPKTVRDFTTLRKLY